MFNTGSSLLDAVVLSVVAREQAGTYGYKITQDVRSVLDVSESSLYPVLRRLQTGGLLETYDQEFSGRNRRYYKITAQGMEELNSYRNDWREYCSKVNRITEKPSFGRKAVFSCPDMSDRGDTINQQGILSHDSWYDGTACDTCVTMRML